jgi:hypothetical protein
MAIPAKPKKWLEPVASLKGTGASAAEASTAIQGLDATANDSRMPQQRARLVRLQPPRSADRRLLGQRQAREEAMASAVALAVANT